MSNNIRSPLLAETIEPDDPSDLGTALPKYKPPTATREQVVLTPSATAAPTPSDVESGAQFLLRCMDYG